MDIRPSLRARWARASILATLALTLAVLAHCSAGGLVPSGSWFVAMLVGGTVASARFLRREASTARIITMVVTGQAALHFVMSAVAGHAEEVGEPRPHGLLAILRHTCEHVLEDISADPTMALSHLLAAAIVGVWLGIAERSAWRLLRAILVWFLRRALTLREASSLVIRLRARPRHAEPAGPIRLLQLAHTCVRRGPPALLCAA